MTYSEKIICFPCSNDTLLGVITTPEKTTDIGVLIIVGGPQYRVGSHRQFLLLSRSLACAGYPTMRFDYRGMGDSTGTLRNFENIDEDINAAINTFIDHCPQIKHIVLWGLCDAASASLLYYDKTQDQRVSGMVLLNPWIRSEASLAKTQIRHYYGQRLLQKEFWYKLLTGKLQIWSALSSFFNKLNQARQNVSLDIKDNNLPFQKKMQRGLSSFRGKLLLILSGQDYTAKEFLDAIETDTVWQDIFAHTKTTKIELLKADHTFSTAIWRKDVEEATIQWLKTRLDE